MTELTEDFQQAELQTQLRSAVKRGWINHALDLMEQGVTPDAALLFLTVKKGLTDLAARMIEDYGATPDSGMVAYAVKRGWNGLARTMLDNGAQLDDPTAQYAAAKGYTSITRYAGKPEAASAPQP